MTIKAVYNCIVCLHFALYDYNNTLSGWWRYHKRKESGQGILNYGETSLAGPIAGEYCKAPIQVIDMLEYEMYSCR